MPSSNVTWDINGSVGVVTLNRPEARNALTWEMYDALVELCDTAEAAPDVRVLIIRGAGGAFAAGTDIRHFRDFFSAEAGVQYEHRLDAVIDRIERLPIITIAEVDGPAVGGGCVIAMACDLRVCSDRARFGVPIARTVGNCLSITNMARMVDLLGAAVTRDLLFSGRLMDAQEALARGLANTVVPSPALQAETIRMAADLSTRAPSTVRATKATLLRLRDHRRPSLASADDILRECYGSDEFREGAEAFLDGRRPQWT